jgi:catechol 2,3-dioxygenase-like lactoylglutathione lyase family enzyme
VNRVASILGLDHVQLAMPRGEEDTARQFYAGILGLTELEKPPKLAKRGGLWFALGGQQQVHLGVEDEFRPARKAHPAILVHGVAELRERLTSRGFAPIDDEPLPGFQRFYVADPFGNRLEFLERMADRPGAARRNKSSSQPRFTDTQGQYLAFIVSYFRMFRRAPAEADMQRHFQVSPPSVHQMVLTLERRGLISRRPGVARSIELLVPPEEIPELGRGLDGPR